MRLLHEIDSPIAGEFILSIVYSPTEYPRRIIVSVEETIHDVKTFCSPWIQSYSDEIDVLIRRDYPYPLREEMPLGQLQEEHRTLFISSRDPNCVSLPLRYIRMEIERRILDLTSLRPEWMIHVERWLHDDPHFHEIHLDGTRVDTNDLLYLLGEIVRTLPVIQRIRIEGSSQTHPEAVAYLRYHLAADQYRTTPVETAWL